MQAEVLDLLRDLRRTFGLSLLLITHDLGVVAEMADRVAVMYCGRIVEQAPVSEMFRAPAHPYTRGLLASIPGGAIGRTSDGDSRSRAAARPAGRRLRLCAAVRAIDSRRVTHRARRRRTSDRDTTCGVTCTPRQDRRPCTVRRPGLQIRLSARDAARAGHASRQGVPRPRLVPARHRACAPSMTSRSTFSRARHSASSANPDRARRRPGRCVLRLIEPTSGEIHFKDMDVRALVVAATCAARDGTSRSCFRTRTRRSTRACASAPSSQEPLIIHKLGTRDEQQARVRQLFELVGLDPDAGREVPARVQRRPAAADRPGARARARAVVHRLRRAGLGARRVGAGAGRESAARSAEAAWPDVSLHRARSAARAPDLRSRRRDVPRPHRRARAGRDSCSPRRRIRTRRRFCRRFRISSLDRSWSGSRSIRPDTHQVPSERSTIDTSPRCKSAGDRARIGKFPRDVANRVHEVIDLL